MPDEGGRGDRGSLLVSARGSCWADNACRSHARDTGQPFGADVLTAAGDAASTALLLRAGDAGNGYPASPWVTAGGSSGVGSRESAWQLAGVGRVRARSLRMERFSGCS
jgi:hypothetical protein